MRSTRPSSIACAKSSRMPPRLVSAVVDPSGPPRVAARVVTSPGFPPPRTAIRAQRLATSKKPPNRGCRQARLHITVCPPAGLGVSRFHRTRVGPSEPRLVMPIPGNGQASFQPVWPEDVADCVLAALPALHWRLGGHPDELPSGAVDLAPRPGRRPAPRGRARAAAGGARDRLRAVLGIGCGLAVVVPTAPNPRPRSTRGAEMRSGVRFAPRLNETAVVGAFRITRVVRATLRAARRRGCAGSDEDSGASAAA